VLSLPLVHRELLVAARRRSGIWIRLGSTGGAILLGCIWMAWISMVGSASNAGRVLFTLLSVILWLGSTVSGVFLTSDSISSERRDGTLGLLFLTRISPWQIVSGKLAAGSIRAISLVLGVAPVLAMTLLMGGVTVGEFWRLLLTFGVTTVASLSLGLMVSASARSAGGALLSSAGLMLLWHLVPVAAQELAALYPGQPVAAVLDWLVLSPVAALSAGTDMAFRASPAPFWRAVIGMAALVPAAVAVATWSAGRGWTSGSWSGGTGASGQKSPRRRRAFPDGRNPLTTLLALGWPALAIAWSPVALLVVGTWILVRDGGGDLSIVLFLGSWLHVVPVGILAWSRTQSLAELRTSGFLDVLVTTPLDNRPDRDRGEGILAAVGSAFNKPVLFALGGILLAEVAMVSLNLALGRREASVFALLALGPQLGGALLRVLVVSALGTWFALSLPNPGRAFLITAGLGLLVPMVIPCLLDWPLLIGLYAWAKYRLNNPLRQILADNPVRA